MKKQPLQKQPPEVFLEISQNSLENTCVRVFFNKVAGLRPLLSFLKTCNILQMSILHQNKKKCFHQEKRNTSYQKDRYWTSWVKLYSFMLTSLPQKKKNIHNKKQWTLKNVIYSWDLDLASQTFFYHFSQFGMGNYRINKWQ